VREWPLLLVLLAPLIPRTLRLEAGRAVLVVFGVIAGWWLLERFGALQQGMRATRDPLRCARLAARRLGRNRWLLGALVALWVLSWLGQGAEMMGYMARHPADAAEAASRGGMPWAERLELAADEYVVTAMLMADLERRFPNALGALGGGFLFVALAAVIGFGVLRFGSARSSDERGRMAWPFRLTVLYLLTTIETHLWWLRPDLIEPWGISPLRWTTWAIGVLTFVWSAPSSAAVWHLLLQLVRGRKVDPWLALHDAAQTWPLFVPLLLVMTLPSMVFTPSWMLWPRGDAARLIGVASSAAGAVLPLAVMLVPWLIADGRVGLRRALTTSWSFATQRPGDIFAFVLRFTAAIAVLWTAVDLFAPSVRHIPLSLTGLVRFLAISPLELLGTLSVGVLSLALADAWRRQASAPAPATGR